MIDAFIIRDAKSSDRAAMEALIFEHGRNQWNYLPESVRDHLQKIGSDGVGAVVAEKDGAIVGFITFHPSTHFNRYRPSHPVGEPHGYVREAVVHRDCAGKGLGTRLLQQAVVRLRAEGFDEIYIDRHEENAASAGMMKKAGFTEVDTFADPEHRTTGSCRTTVCRIRC